MRVVASAYVYVCKARVASGSHDSEAREHAS
jgi:hypothetical protein